MNIFKLYAQDFKLNIEKYQAVFKDPKTPKIPKFFLSLAIGYTSNTLDIIPDILPFFGHLDDYILVPLFIYLARLTTPQSLLSQYKINTH